MSKIIKFVGENFGFDMPSSSILKFSGVVSDLCECSDENIKELPLSSIQGIEQTSMPILLEFIKEYVIYYENREIEQIEKPLKTSLSDVISEWDNEFLNKIVPFDEKEIKTYDKIIVLNELIILCNYLNIEPLLQLLCAKVASILRGKNKHEMREIMDQENDFTPEEEAQIEEESRWVEEC